MNWKRTRLVQEKVKRAIFLETCKINEMYFSKMTKVELYGIYNKIKEILEEQNYRNYVSVMKSVK